MTYTPSRIAGAWVMEISPITDARGFFAMTWLPNELRERGMNPALAQCNLAFNHQRGTLRGMHFQKLLEREHTSCTSSSSCRRSAVGAV